jgi:hypothetical protein
VYQVVRRPPKQFLQRRPDPDHPGEWIWDLKGVQPIPYRLPELLASDSRTRVWIQEGEKDCDNLHALGLVATCNPMGAGKWRDEYSRYLQGRDVVILPDNDEPGRKHAEKVANSLLRFATSVKVLRLPDLPPKGDVSDWLESGGTVAELIRLAEECPNYQPARTPSPGQKRPFDRTTVWRAIQPHVIELAQEWGLDITATSANEAGFWECRAFDRADDHPSASINERSGVYHDFATGENIKFLELGVLLEAYGDIDAAIDDLGSRFCSHSSPFDEETDWPEPEPLREQLLPVPTLDPAMIPAPCRGWLVDVAARIGCALDFPAVGALVGLSSIVGRQLGIRPKRFDDWTVVPNLWGAIVGRPGLLKSPALREALRPLRNLSEAARKQYESALPAHQARVTVAKARRVDLERQLKEAIRKSNEAVESIESGLAALVEPPPLSERRYETNDPTIEKLGEILAANPRGVLVSRDELVGFMRTLDKKGRENDRSFFLESWNGNTSYIYDRIGRGTIRIAAACVSIVGGIQPGPLVGYLKVAACGGLSDDGLMPRFQLLVYPDSPGKWRNVDRQPDFEARDRAYRIFTALDSIDLTRFVGHVCPCADDEIPTLHFTIDAQDLFDEWRTDLERKLGSEYDDPAMESHLAKYRSLMPSLALLFHLVDIADGSEPGPVSLTATISAAAWCDYLEAHARRVYQAAREGDLEGARALAEKLRSRKLSHSFTARDVYKHHWGSLDNPQDTERAIDVLEEHGILVPEQQETGGRPQTIYHVNPRWHATEEATR